MNICTGYLCVCMCVCVCTFVHPFMHVWGIWTASLIMFYCQQIHRMTQCTHTGKNWSGYVSGRTLRGTGGYISTNYV